MSREIKFRAWDKARTEYLSGGRALIEILPRVRPKQGVVYLDTTEYEYTSRFDLEQYTGLKDKNGVEIYEGDILSWWNGVTISDVDGDITYHSQPGMRYSRVKNSVRPVVFEKSSFCVEGGNPIGFSTNLSSEEIEVIGNIHQNPELLDSA